MLTSFTQFFAMYSAIAAEVVGRPSCGILMPL
jgi:hypothetical protein